MAAMAQRVFPREGRGGALPAGAGEPWAPARPCGRPVTGSRAILPTRLAVASLWDRGVPPLCGTEQEPGSLTQLPAASRAREGAPAFCQEWARAEAGGERPLLGRGQGLPRGQRNRHYDEPSARAWSQAGVPPGSCYVLSIYSGYFPMGKPRPGCVGAGCVLRCVSFWISKRKGRPALPSSGQALPFRAGTART